MPDMEGWGKDDVKGVRAMQITWVEPGLCNIFEIKNWFCPSESIVQKVTRLVERPSGALAPTLPTCETCTPFSQLVTGAQQFPSSAFFCLSSWQASPIHVVRWHCLDSCWGQLLLMAFPVVLEPRWPSFDAAEDAGVWWLWNLGCQEPSQRPGPYCCADSCACASVRTLVRAQCHTVIHFSPLLCSSQSFPLWVPISTCNNQSFMWQREAAWETKSMKNTELYFKSSLPRQAFTRSFSQQILLEKLGCASRLPPAEAPARSYMGAGRGGLVELPSGQQVSRPTLGKPSVPSSHPPRFLTKEVWLVWAQESVFRIRLMCRCLVARLWLGPQTETPDVPAKRKPQGWRAVWGLGHGNRTLGK